MLSAHTEEAKYNRASASASVGVEEGFVAASPTLRLPRAMLPYIVPNPLAQITCSMACGLMAPGVVQGFGSGLALATNVQHSQIARGKIFCKIFPQLFMKANGQDRSQRLAAAVKQGRKSKGATLTPCAAQNLNSWTISVTNLTNLG